MRGSVVEGAIVGAEDVRARAQAAGSTWLVTPQVAVDVVANWYGVPSLVPRNALWHRDCADEAFRGSFCVHGGVYSCGHVNSLGHEIIAHVLTSFLAEITERARRIASPRSATTASLPPPLFQHAMEGESYCAHGASLGPLLQQPAATGNWKLVGASPHSAQGAVVKPGLLSTCAPDVLGVDVS